MIIYGKKIIFYVTIFNKFTLTNVTNNKYFGGKAPWLKQGKAYNIKDNSNTFFKNFK